MGKEFFDGLGEAITKTARELGGRAETLYETQKMKNRISGEERQIRKIMVELGRIIYRRYLDGTPLEDSQRVLCEQIDQRMEKIARYKESLAGVKGRKICPSCGSSVDGSASFCPHCGAACPTRETEAEAGDVVEDTAEEMDADEQPEEESSENNAEEKAPEQDGNEEMEEDAEGQPEEESAKEENAEAEEPKTAGEE